MLRLYYRKKGGKGERAHEREIERERGGGDKERNLKK